ncbi:MAG: hypothetical protein KF901_19850 [Myxococcales bacterium]|nr:hypothetical protein [Myxococcales bacterium]
MRRLLLVLLALVFAAPPTADARRSDSHAYRYDQVWSASLRLLRVDYGFPLRDRDENLGYVLFDYVDGGRSVPGSFEVVRTRQGEREVVRVTVNIPAMPSYVERMILDKLQRKLREEYGEPLPAPPRREPSEERGAEGDDASADEEEAPARGRRR